MGIELSEKVDVRAYFHLFIFLLVSLHAYKLKWVAVFVTVLTYALISCSYNATGVSEQQGQYPQLL